MELIKNIAIVAHDNCKKTMLEFVEPHHEVLLHHNLFATGTTGSLVEKLLQEKCTDVEGVHFKGVHKMKSGPLGGDQQLGGLIADGKIDVLIFFWDPMEPQPHDVDVKALLRLAVLYNIPTASNRSSADFLISSPFFSSKYEILDCGYTK
ncbi:methylglyoxal synthase [Halodesulfovibrio marinisediminis]|uniref:Methylglyoxal synthase n=1 Tax=Halodesulfovibrio marinisediminis DSM 17456 TaxID=1121457 RepID=A0A1N6E936_9BACT|nr:methylglyoxal synthase [Halodesulfovibrio marinisediminis]SIN79565.1 methylglyoxal synthase [Halodesulfovibrio marinisediminis DSM 17456]